MKSVGEAMALGRNFTEALQKALISLDKAGTYFRWDTPLSSAKEELLEQVKIPTEKRLIQVMDAIRAGASLEELYEATKIDRWFLDQLFLLNEVAKEIREAEAISPQLLTKAKRHGFSDLQIGQIRSVSDQVVREVRKAFGIRPVYKTVDTCAGEFPAQTPYYYSSYDLTSEVKPRQRLSLIHI